MLARLTITDTRSSISHVVGFFSSRSNTAASYKHPIRAKARFPATRTPKSPFWDPRSTQPPPPISPNLAPFLRTPYFQGQLWNVDRCKCGASIRHVGGVKYRPRSLKRARWLKRENGGERGEANYNGGLGQESGALETGNTRPTT